MPLIGCTISRNDRDWCVYSQEVIVFVRVDDPISPSPHVTTPPYTGPQFRRPDSRLLLKLPTGRLLGVLVRFTCSPGVNHRTGSLIDGSSLRIRRRRSSASNTTTRPAGRKTGARLVDKLLSTNKSETQVSPSVEANRLAATHNCQTNRVGGSLATPVLPHHRTYSSYPAVSLNFVIPSIGRAG
jgi:hypothetical protein